MEDERTARERASAQSGPELTERQRSVLRAVVEDYVLTRVPVGLEGAGRALWTRRLAGHRAQRHGRARGAGPADASAHQRRPGALRPRLPPLRRVADAGCRARPRPIELMIRHQFSQVQLTSNEWLRLAASILAGSTRVGRVVTPAAVATRAVRPRSSSWSSPTGRGSSCSCWPTATSSAPPRPRDARAPDGRASPSARPRSTRRPPTLNAELAGLTAPQVRRASPKLSPLAGPRRPRWWRRCSKSADSVVVEEVFTDGIGQRPRAARVRRGREAAARSSRSCSAPTSWSSWCRC